MTGGESAAFDASAWSLLRIKELEEQQKKYRA